MTTNLNVVKPDSAAEKTETLKVHSQRLNIGVTFVNAGEGVDELTGRRFSWGDSVRISTGDKAIKLSALQMAYVLEALKDPLMVAELKKRVVVEKEALMKEIAGFTA